MKVSKISSQDRLSPNLNERASEYLAKLRACKTLGVALKKYIFIIGSLQSPVYNREGWVSAVKASHKEYWFYSEYNARKFVRYDGTYLPNYTASYPDTQ